MALGCLVVICVALGASFLKVDFQEDFDEDPRLRGHTKLEVIPRSLTPSNRYARADLGLD